MINHNKYPISVALLMILFMSVTNASSEMQASTNYIIEVDVIDGGGGYGNSINYDLLYSVSQSSIIGDLSSSNYFIYAGYWNALSGVGINHHISGSGYNYPDAEFRGSLSLDIWKSDLSSSWLEYYYSKLRIHCKSTSISEVSVMGDNVTITGFCTVNGVTGYTFEVTINDGSTDSMGIVIYHPDNSVYFQTIPIPLSGGDLIIDIPITCVNLPVRLSEEIADYYSFVQDAYDVAMDGITIQSHDKVLAESINFNRNISVYIDGGFNCSYLNDTGVTRINGNMTISDGTVTIGNIILQ